MASYVVSGIGFGRREVQHVRGLNTALRWCSTRSECWPASGHLVFTLIGTGTVAVYLWGARGRLVDRDNAVEREAGLQVQ